VSGNRSYLLNVVTVNALQARRGVGHGNYLRSDVGEVQVEVTFDYSAAVPRHKVTYRLNHIKNI
jgi:hypothetical protein